MKKRKNPEFEKIAKKILPFIDFYYLDKGGNGETYYFNLKKTKIIDSNLKIPPGNYILKINKYADSLKKIEYLKELSYFNLIPKIYYNDKFIIIMEFQNGFLLKNLLKYEFNFEEKLEIFENISNLLELWHNLGFAHNDLSNDNIFIDFDLKPHFIDPEYNSEFRPENDIKQLKSLKYKYLK